MGDLSRATMRLADMPEESRAQRDISRERMRQDEKWGQQNHDPFVWLAILLEEVGEAGKAAIEHDAHGYRDEMVQVAAVARAVIESFDRNRERDHDTLKRRGNNATEGSER